MGKVIAGRFGPKEEEVLLCAFCNEGQLFWINEDGTITCVACASRQKPPRPWTERCLGETKKEEEEIEEED